MEAVNDFESVVISKSAVKLRAENGSATNHVFINTFNTLSNDTKRKRATEFILFMPVVAFHNVFLK